MRITLMCSECLKELECDIIQHGSEATFRVTPCSCNCDVCDCEVKLNEISDQSDKIDELEAKLEKVTSIISGT